MSIYMQLMLGIDHFLIAINLIPILESIAFKPLMVTSCVEGSAGVGDRRSQGRI